MHLFLFGFLIAFLGMAFWTPRFLGRIWNIYVRHYGSMSESHPEVPLEGMEVDPRYWRRHRNGTDPAKARTFR